MPVLRGQPVKARRDDRPHRVRQAGQAAVALAQRLDVLLGVERIAAGALDQLGDPPRRERSARERGDQRRRVRRQQRPERERGAVGLAAAPLGPALEQLGARGGDEQHRRVRGPLDEIVDEVEQAVVGPVDILKQEDQRPLLGQRLEQRPPRGELLRRAGRPLTQYPRSPRPPGR